MTAPPPPSIHVDVVRFVRYQHHALPLEVVQGHAVFFRIEDGGVKPLDGGEQDVDVVGGSGLEVGHLADVHPLVVDDDGGGKQVLRGRGVEEVVPRFVDDVGAVHEEQKVAVALGVEVGNGGRHHQGLTRAGGHQEEQLVVDAGLAIEILLPVIQEVAQGAFLVRAHPKTRVQVLNDVQRQRCALDVARTQFAAQHFEEVERLGGHAFTPRRSWN